MKNGLGFLESLGGFVVWFWLVNLGSKGFEVWPLGFKLVRSSKFSLKMLIVVWFVGSHGVLLPENLRHVYVIVFVE